MRIRFSLFASLCTCGLLVAALAACGEDIKTDDPTSSSGTGGTGDTAQGGNGGGSSGGNGGAAGGQGGTAGGYDAMICDLCISPLVEDAQNQPGPCGPSFDLCHDDPTCELWLECTDSCLDSNWTLSCMEACDATYQSAATLYGSFATCVCNTCGTELHCTPICP